MATKCNKRDFLDKIDNKQFRENEKFAKCEKNLKKFKILKG